MKRSGTKRKPDPTPGEIIGQLDPLHLPRTKWRKDDEISEAEQLELIAAQLRVIAAWLPLQAAMIDALETQKRVQGRKSMPAVYAFGSARSGVEALLQNIGGLSAPELPPSPSVC